jgi:hypothetical protein
VATSGTTIWGSESGRNAAGESDTKTSRSLKTEQERPFTPGEPDGDGNGVVDIEFLEAGLDP